MLQSLKAGRQISIGTQQPAKGKEVASAPKFGDLVNS